MIFNTTNVPLEGFTVMQRNALHGESLVSRHVESIDDFERVYRETLVVPTKIIVDKDNVVLANDILNYVGCPVVTLDVEAVDGMNNCKFIPYD